VTFDWLFDWVTKAIVLAGWVVAVFLILRTLWRHYF